MDVIRHQLDTHADDPFVEALRRLGGSAPVRLPTRGHGRWIIRMRRAYDIEDLGLVYALAVVANRGDKQRSDVEAFLALTPWVDGGEALAMAVARLVGYGIAQQFG